jgi:hypothetical protein
MIDFISRYISIVHPIKISRLNPHKRLCLIFIFIWSIGFIIALPNLYLLKLHPHYHRPQYYLCGLSDHSTDSQLITFYKYTESIFFFFLPAFIQVSLFMMLFIFFRKKRHFVRLSYVSELFKKKLCFVSV